MNKYQKELDFLRTEVCEQNGGVFNCEECIFKKYCMYYSYGETLQEAIEKANKYDEKETTFENSCNALFEKDLLCEAIKEKCQKLNKYYYNKYKIYLHNGYPCVSIAHNKFRIHRLLGEFIYGKIEKDYVIHHIDGNRLNNKKDNLQLISKSEHSSIHNKNKHYTPCLKAIKNARNKNFRSDITKEKCEELRKNGYTLEKMSIILCCSKNTISRRLGMKDYETKNNILDWGGE